MSDLLLDIGRRVAEVAGPAYFVGGCVRDLLRGEPLKDIDFAVAADPHTAGRVLAKEYGGHFFWLRQEDEVARVVLPEQDRLQIDLVVMHGSLEEDLRARDLTINAMAVCAEEGLNPGVKILDPTGGRADLAAGIVRFVSQDAPVRDPLRTLRALRFRWKLDFDIAAETESRLRDCVPLLERVSSERIRDELFQLLALGTADAALGDCYRFGMVRWLTGSERLGGADAELLDLSARRVHDLLAALSRPGLPQELPALLETQATPPRRRREVLLWAGALEPLLNPSEAGEAARSLALSSEERQLIEKALGAAPQAEALCRRWPVTGAARFHLFRSAGPAGPEAVLLTAARDGWSEAVDALLLEAVRRLLHPERSLLSGQDVMRIAGLQPGPEVGRLLLALEEERADGRLTSPEEAAEWVARQAAQTGGG